jgi:hypothetical protein
MYCFADTLPKNEKRKTSKLYCPKESASFLSRLSFSWFTSMAILGWRKPLTINDLWEVRDGDRSYTIFTLFNKYWLSMLTKRNDRIDISQTNGIATNGSAKKYKINGTKTKSESQKDKPEILRTMVKAFWFYFLAGAFFKLLSDILTFVSPQIMK